MPVQKAQGFRLPDSPEIDGAIITAGNSQPGLPNESNTTDGRIMAIHQGEGFLRGQIPMNDGVIETRGQCCFTIVGDRNGMHGPAMADQFRFGRRAGQEKTQQGEESGREPPRDRARLRS